MEDYGGLWRLCVSVLQFLRALQKVIFDWSHLQESLVERGRFYSKVMVYRSLEATERNLSKLL